MKIFEPTVRGFCLVLISAVLFTAKAQAQLGYIVIDNQTGHILDSSKPKAKLQVASLTKIATAMVVFDWAHLNNVDLSTTIPVRSSSFANGATSPAGLVEGDLVSLRDLLYCALLSSDNVAANALAEHVGAKVPNPEGLDPAGNFVAQMNALARSLWMKRTLFLNPTGMDNMESGARPHSTAEDMARLSRHAYNDAAFKFFVSQKKRVVHFLRNGADYPVEIRNTNELLGVQEIDGVKTGRTRRAGDCLILSAERPPESRREGETVMVTPRRVTVVVLGSTDRFRDGLALLQKGWGLYDVWASSGRPVKKETNL
jgi:D-alanyl-D-alanine carboxypeptidase (penicillin-binding protein 5/6)